MDWLLQNANTVLLWVLATVLMVAIFRGHRKLRAERAELEALRRRNTEVVRDLPGRDGWPD